MIGGNFNVLSVDVYKQVVGQLNFSMGAVVGMLLLLPSIISFAIDYSVRRKIKAQLTALRALSAPTHRVGDALARSAWRGGMLLATWAWRLHLGDQALAL